MKEEPFTIRAYGKSELAMLYLPKHSKNSALKILKSWIQLNPRLRKLVKSKGNHYTPREVRAMVEELGEPFDIE